MRKSTSQIGDLQKLTQKALCTIFNVGLMTIYLWRHGTPKRSPIPHTTEKRGDRHRVFFDWNEVKLWARDNEVRIVKYPSDLPLKKIV